MQQYNTEKNLPLISIITVVYNGERYLKQTIESVINQTYKNIEYIVIDGGSIDGTIDIIREYEKRISYWVSEPDEGLYDAMNKGIKLAKGDLIGMINSDDWYELNAVELVVNSYLKNPNKKIFHADRFNVDKKGDKKLRKFNSSSFKFKYYGMTYNHPSMFISKEEYKWHHYNVKFKSLSDYQFVLEAYMHNKDNFYYLNEPIVNYRLDGISSQQTRLNSIIEGYMSRKSAGLNIGQRLFSVIFGLSVILILHFKRTYFENT